MAAHTTAHHTTSNADAEAAAQAAAHHDQISHEAHLDRLAKGEEIIRRDVLWALGAGVVPIPGVDVAAVTGVQLKMMRELTKLYGKKFSEGIAKKVIYSLLGSVGVVGVGSIIGGSLAKLIPGLGTTLGVISVPIIAGAFTHGLGQVILMHLEAGGTLLDFDPVAMRLYFKQEFEKAKETVAQLQKDAAKGHGKSA